MRTYTKESLIDELKNIKNMGWIPSARQENAGGIGNTLEDLLGIDENNLPIPNASEWELKCQRKGSNSLTTLFHFEPSPRAIRFVPSIFLPKYGWFHEAAGVRYPDNEMSFRQTIHGQSRSDRGFKVVINFDERKIYISFDSNSVDKRHAEWLRSVERRVGLGELEPQPYWAFDDLFLKAGTKLINCFYVQADVMKQDKVEYFHYNKILMLQEFNFEKLLIEIDNGNILIDFDARTGHNHGTKFRMRQNAIENLYTHIQQID